MPTSKEAFITATNALSGLAEVETVIRSKLQSDAPLLEEIPRYLLEIGGKRMRPMLCLLVAKSLGQEKPSKQLVDVAAGIELIHMATLLHDDIIDQSPLRRHQDSPLKKFGLGNTLLSGDFLLVRAFSLCALLDRYVIEETEKACIELTEGEILETPLWREKHTIESSLRISQKKTAALFKLAACTAGHLSGLNDAQSAKLGSFGESLGIAFQILDDILDVTSSEDLLGKKSGIDLRERKPTAVNVTWLATGSKLSKTLLTQPGANEDAFITEALHELRGSPVIEDCRKLATDYSNAALANLADLESQNLIRNPEAFLGLKALIQYTLSRLQ